MRWLRIYIATPKGRKGSIVRKSWTKAPQQDNANFCLSSLSVSLLLNMLTATHSSPLDWLPTLSAAFLSRSPHLWHLQHLGVSNTVQTSLSQLQVGIYLGLSQGWMQLPHAWPQQLSLTKEEDSKTPFL